MAAKSHKQDTGQALHDLFREVFALQAELAAVMDKVHLQAGLSTSQNKIMRVLSRMGPATVPDMAANLKVSRQFVQTVCNDLYDRGFLEFEENPRHKRSKLLTLTARGLTAFRQARRKENAIILKALPSISSEKAAQACDLLNLIRKTISSLAEEA